MPDEYTVPYPDPDAMRIDVWLAAVSGLSRSRVKDLILSGDITHDGKPLKNASRTVKPGETYAVALPAPTTVSTAPQDIPLDIMFEDEHVIVINKACGIVVHPSFGHPDGTIVNAVMHHCPQLAGVGGELRPGIVHRLDRFTSGVMVVAKTQLAMQALSQSFQNGLVRKTYRTLVHGVPPDSGRIETLIGRHPIDRKRMAVLQGDGRIAITFYAVAETFGNTALMHVKIQTGRTHQIRVHMKHLGFPVLGDPVYGRPRADAHLPLVPRRQMLHAWKLAFPHPVTGELARFEAPMPADFTDMCESLRNQPHDDD